MKRLFRKVIGRLPLFVLALSSALVASPSPAEAAAITVNTTSDVVADDGQCSLREAITAANNDAASGSTVGECPAGSGDDTITLPAGSYTLSLVGATEDANATGDLDITDHLTITGASPSTTLIDGGSIDRVLHITTGATVQLNSVTIANGDISAHKTAEASSTRAR